jgi:hypothetical protein
MPHSRWLTVGLLFMLASCALTHSPDTHGPQWIDRSVDALEEKMGKPDRVVRLPAPSLSTVWLYTGGAQPGFAICERNYYVRGSAVIGYAEHGSDPTCNRVGGRRE